MLFYYEAQFSLHIIHIFTELATCYVCLAHLISQCSISKYSIVHRTRVELHITAEAVMAYSGNNVQINNNEPPTIAVKSQAVAERASKLLSVNKVSPLAREQNLKETFSKGEAVA